MALAHPSKTHRFPQPCALRHSVLPCAPLRQFVYWQSATTTREDQVDAEAAEEDRVAEARDLIGLRGGQHVGGRRR